MLNAANIAQILMSGLLMGLIYALIAAGLSLIFGLMDVVNFAHGEFLMTAMYASFGLVVMLSLDPLILSPIVAAIMFILGAFCYRAIIVHAMRARTNVGMVQVFATFGLAIVIRGLAQFAFTPDYRSIPKSWLGGQTFSVVRRVHAGAAACRRGGVAARFRRALALDEEDRFRQGA